MTDTTTAPPRSPQQKPATKTPVKEYEFFVTLKHLYPELSLKSVCLLMAQWALETGRGEKCMNYNIGNFKGFGDRDYTYFQTWERLPEAKAQAYIAKSSIKEPAEFVRQLPSLHVIVRFKPCHPVARFAAYDSLEEGVRDYVSQLQRKFEEAWHAVENADPHGFINGLLHGHYFTGSALLYADGIYKLAREYENRFGVT